MKFRILASSLLLALLAACGNDTPGTGDGPGEGEAQTSPAEVASGGGETTGEVSPEDQEAILSSGLLGEWRWVGFQGMDDTSMEVDDPARYTLTFRVDGVAVQADCNSGRGSFDLNASAITFGPVATTRMACPGDSLGDRYLRYLADVRGWTIRDGHLFLSLMMDAGVMEFEPGSGGA